MKQIGVIDSGLGGLLVLSACVKAHPEYDYVFIGDQLHAPYGEKTPAQIYQYAKAMLAYLEHQGVQDVIIGCNTICANVLAELKKTFPNMHLYDIIGPTVKQLPKNVFKRIAVLSTVATANTHAYQKAIRDHDAEIVVNEVGCPAFVPLVENGASGDTCLNAVKQVGKQVSADAILLGCTHYPYLKKIIEDVFQVPVYDSNDAIVTYFPWENQTGTGSVRIYSTLDGDSMTKQMKQLLQKDWKADTLVLDF